MHNGIVVILSIVCPFARCVSLFYIISLFMGFENFARLAQACFADIYTILLEYIISSHLSTFIT